MRWVCLLLFGLAALPALAGPYEGLYRPAGSFGEGWDCRTIGGDGGALAVRDGQFFGVENTCQLTNPVPIRDMDATLYDAICQAEGFEDRYRVMLMRTRVGIAYVRDGAVAEFQRCD